MSDMGHLWHPTSGVDSGIDGEIELRDPATGEVRNFRIGVQSKATEGVWRSETDEGFLYRVKPDDLEYWLGSNQPVLLVCSRPNRDEAYWRDVQAWAKDPVRRASGLIDFQKARDRFDAAAAARFFTVDARDRVVLEPPGPLPVPERLQSNLLPLHWDTDQVWSVGVPTADGGELFQRGLAAGVPRSDVALRDGRLWSLAPFSDAYVLAIGATPSSIRSTDLAALAQSSDASDRHLVGDLARRSLLTQHHRELRWSGPGRVAYFRLFQAHPKRKFRWGSGTGRTVVLPRNSTQHSGLSGYRHDAARLGFRRLGDQWCLAITPTYLFTYDGRQLSSFHADALKKMKGFDRASAVSQQLRMWAWLFTRPASVLDSPTQLAFHFGAPAEIELDVSPPEAAWKTAPDDTRTEDSSSEVPTLFDKPDIA